MKQIEEVLEVLNQWENGLITNQELQAGLIRIAQSIEVAQPGEVDRNTGLKVS